MSTPFLDTSALGLTPDTNLRDNPDPYKNMLRAWGPISNDSLLSLSSMRMGLSRKYILPFLAALLVFTGISIIYSQPSLLRHAGQSISEDSKCFRPASYEHIDFIGPADSITLEKPVTLHEYRDDGLLWVSSTASHPIHDLIADAANKWLIKNNVASRNLREAVGEYRRRYGRLPPKGFDKW